MSHNPPHHDPRPNSTTALVVKNLTKTYGSSIAIKNVSFHAQAGEIFGLLGPNGAGKTTTIRTIATLLTPDSGQITVEGFNTATQAVKVRQNIGVLTTDIGLYDRFSGRENLTYFGKLYGLSKSQLQQRIMELSGIFEMGQYIDNKAGGYSTGMKQKLAIARAIIHDPHVMILDEPTTGLDVLAAQTVLNVIVQAKKNGKCVIFSTHNMLDADTYCDKVLIMHKGMILTIDTPANIKKSTKMTNLAEAFLAIITNPHHNNLP
jgi:sodium transport system ATP-binding protein